MAGGASRSRRRKARGHVIRNVPANRGRAQKRRLVTAIAVRRTERVVIVDVTGGAGGRSGRRVRPRQRKSGYAVVESRRGPGDGSVATGAIRRSKGRSGGRVHRIIRLLPIIQMALRIPTICRGDR